MRCNGNLHQPFLTILYILLFTQGLMAANTRMPTNVLSPRAPQADWWQAFLRNYLQRKQSRNRPPGASPSPPPPNPPPQAQPAQPPAAPVSQPPPNPQQPVQVTPNLPSQVQPAQPPVASSAPTPQVLQNPQGPVLDNSTPLLAPQNTPIPMPTATLTSTPTPTSTPASVLRTANSLNDSSNGCSQIRVRKEWRNMSPDLQRSYINAIKCLLSKPSQLQRGSRLRLYDDFVYVHDRSRSRVHWTASFLPWHRHFIYLQEKALMDCGYSGGLPRWDWTLDANNFTNSPVWSPDPNIGFGSNGFSDDPDSNGNGRVLDGAFAQVRLLYPTQHYLERGFNSPAQFDSGGTIYGSQYYNDVAIQVVQSSENFLNFHVALEGTNPMSSGIDLPGPHGAIHTIIGGDMAPTSYAPNDEKEKHETKSQHHYRIFYLHHGNVDYHWAKWQDASPNSRLSDYSGNRVQGINVNNAKLADILTFMGLAGGKDIPVRNSMNTRAFPYCYEYE